MAMKRRRATVYLGDLDNPDAFEVRILNGDHLRAELEGKKYGLGTDAPMHYLTLCAWAAMLREGHYDKGFPDFKAECLDIDSDKESEEVPPTRPAASDGSP